MDKVLNFLKQLKYNNNRDWFEANKTMYREVTEQFNSFVEKLIVEVGQFDSSIKGLEVKDCTYRIYRDVRFSPNKEPYKTHIGAYVCRGGKKSPYAGYYFHIEPQGNGFIGGHLLSSGFYLPEPKVLKSIRDEIVENGNKLTSLIQKAKGFNLSQGSKLKRVPLGYSQDNEFAEYLKLKDIYLEQFVDDDFILNPNLLENVVNEFRKTYDFLKFLNDAAEFAYDADN